MTYLRDILIAIRISLWEHPIDQQRPNMDDVFFVNVDTVGEVFLYQLFSVRRDAPMSLLELRPCPFDGQYPASDFIRTFHHRWYVSKVEMVVEHDKWELKGFVEV